MKSGTVEWPGRTNPTGCLLLIKAGWSGWRPKPTPAVNRTTNGRAVAPWRHPWFAPTGEPGRRPRGRSGLILSRRGGRNRTAHAVVRPGSQACHDNPRATRRPGRKIGRRWRGDHARTRVEIGPGPENLPGMFSRRVAGRLPTPKRIGPLLRLRSRVRLASRPAAILHRFTAPGPPITQRAGYSV